MHKNDNGDSGDFDTSYEKLKARKSAERELVKYKQQVLSAPDDGISDKELISLIKKAQPNIKLTVKQLQLLRVRLIAEQASEVELSENGTTHSLQEDQP